MEAPPMPQNKVWGESERQRERQRERETEKREREKEREREREKREREREELVRHRPLESLTEPGRPPLGEPTAG